MSRFILIQKDLIYTTSINVDGGNNLDSGSNNSIINNVGIDFIQEVKIQTSNFSSEYGRNSGAAVNVVTRSGSNTFHGSGFEFVRNDRLDARNSFAPRRGKLRFNDFGYAIGGPVTIPRAYSGKDKFFFFFGQEWKKIRLVGRVWVLTGLSCRIFFHSCPKKKKNLSFPL